MSHDLLHNQRMKSRLDLYICACMPEIVYGQSGDIRDIQKYSSHMEEMFS